MALALRQRSCAPPPPRLPPGPLDEAFFSRVRGEVLGGGPAVPCCGLLRLRLPVPRLPSCWAVGFCWGCVRWRGGVSLGSPPARSRCTRPSSASRSLGLRPMGGLRVLSCCCLVPFRSGGRRALAPPCPCGGGGVGRFLCVLGVVALRSPRTRGRSHFYTRARRRGHWVARALVSTRFLGRAPLPFFTQTPMERGCSARFGKQGGRRGGGRSNASAPRCRRRPGALSLRPAPPLPPSPPCSFAGSACFCSFCRGRAAPGAAAAALAESPGPLRCRACAPLLRLPPRSAVLRCRLGRARSAGLGSRTFGGKSLLLPPAVHPPPTAASRSYARPLSSPPGLRRSRCSLRSSRSPHRGGRPHEIPRFAALHGLFSGAARAALARDSPRCRLGRALGRHCVLARLLPSHATLSWWWRRAGPARGEVPTAVGCSGSRCSGGRSAGA